MLRIANILNLVYKIEDKKLQKDITTQVNYSEKKNRSK